VTPEGWAALADLANSITVFGLGGLIIWALLNRKVVTNKTYEERDQLRLEQLADKDEQIAEERREKDEAIAGWRAQSEASKELAEQVSKLAARQRRYDGRGGPPEPGV